LARAERHDSIDVGGAGSSSDADPLVIAVEDNNRPGGVSGTRQNCEKHERGDDRSAAIVKHGGSCNVRCPRSSKTARNQEKFEASSKWFYCDGLHQIDMIMPTAIY
jgi:hypothetical protein